LEQAVHNFLEEKNELPEELFRMKTTGYLISQFCLVLLTISII